MGSRPLKIILLLAFSMLALGACYDNRYTFIDNLSDEVLGNVWNIHLLHRGSYISVQRQFGFSPDQTYKSYLSNDERKIGGELCRIDRIKLAEDYWVYDTSDSALMLSIDRNYRVIDHSRDTIYIEAADIARTYMLTRL